MPIHIGQGTFDTVHIGTRTLGCAFLGASTIFVNQTNLAPTSHIIGATAAGAPIGSTLENSTEVTFTSTVVDPDGLAGGTYTWKRDATASPSGIVTSIPSDGTTVGGNSATIMDGATNVNVSHNYQCFFTDAGGVIIASEVLTIDWAIVVITATGFSDFQIDYTGTGSIATLTSNNQPTAISSLTDFPTAFTDIESFTFGGTSNYADFNTANRGGFGFTSARRVGNRLEFEFNGGQTSDSSGSPVNGQTTARNFMGVVGGEPNWINIDPGGSTGISYSDGFGVIGLGYQRRVQSSTATTFFSYQL